MLLPVINELSSLLSKSTCLDEKAKCHYLHGNKFNYERLILSPIREAPALGAAINAFLNR